MGRRSPGGGRPTRRRLSRSAEFERVYRQGRSKANRFLVLYAFPRGETADGDDDGPRLGLSVSRRVGGAVERARVKRVLREAFWAESPGLPADSDYVVVARPEAGPLAEREGTPGMQRALGELIEGLGGRASAPSSPSAVPGGPEPSGAETPPPDAAGEGPRGSETSRRETGEEAA